MTTKKIDGHMHISQWMRQDGKRTFEALEEYRQTNGIAYVDDMCCTNNADLWDGYEMDQSILGAISKLENPYVFVHGCLYVPEDVALTQRYPFVGQLEELMELGLDGVKICDFKPDAYKRLQVERRLDEYEKYIDCCEKYRVHMCWHAADPVFFWDAARVPEEVRRLGWFYGDGSYPAYEKLIAYANGLLDRHPKLHVQLAHAFFQSDDPDAMETLLQKHPCVTVDLAPGGEMFDGFRRQYDRWRRIFRNYADRFVYATDGSTSCTREEMTDLSEKVLRFLQTGDVFAFSDLYTARGVCLEQEALENILHRNHEREVGAEPKPVNRVALKKYVARYLPLMPDSQNKRRIEEYYRKNLL